MEANWRRFIHDIVKTPKVSTGSRVYGGVMLLAIIIGVFPRDILVDGPDIEPTVYHRLYIQMVYC